MADSRKQSEASKSKDTKPITLVSTWRGRKLDEYTKTELIEIVCELGQSLEQEHYEHSRQLDMLNGLLVTGSKPPVQPSDAPITREEKS